MSSDAYFSIRGIVRAFTVAPELARKQGNRPLVGALREQAIREGNLVQVMEHHNLIVNQGLEAIAKFLGGNAGAPTVGGGTFAELEDLVVAVMELGDATSPPSPAATDTTGVGSLIYQPPLVISYPGPYNIMFSGLLPIGEANGTTITEEALKLSNGLVFAKATFSRAKTSSFALQFDHTIYFARA